MYPLFIQKKKKTPAKQTPTASPKKRGQKTEEQAEVWKWWEEEKLEDGVKWKFLEHKGPVFAPPYEPLPEHVHFYYDGRMIVVGCFMSVLKSVVKM